MWLQENLKLCVWFTSVACIVQHQDSAVLRCHVSKTNSTFLNVPPVSKDSFIRLKMPKLICEDSHCNDFYLTLRPSRMIWFSSEILQLCKLTRHSPVTPFPSTPEANSNDMTPEICFKITQQGVGERVQRWNKIGQMLIVVKARCSSHTHYLLQLLLYIFEIFHNKETL